MEQETAKKTLFDKIYQESIKLVYKTALTYAKYNDDIAQEVVQDTYLQLYTHLESMHLDNIHSWLITTAKHNAINRFKKKSWELADDDIITRYEGTKCNQSTEEVYFDNVMNGDRKIFQENIFQELNEKNQTWCQAVTLVYCMGVPQAEVAADLNLSLNALHSMLFRAKRWIKKNYGNQYEDIEQL